MTSRLDWLVIGIGDITTKRVIPAILSEPRSRLAGLVTRTPAKAEPYGVPSWASLDEALEACPAQAVYVASPVFLHGPHTIAALRSGRHVLCEKPLAMNYAEACTMRDTARECGRTLGVAYYRRMYPKVNRAIELMRAGAIGTPVFAEATSHDWFTLTGERHKWLIDPAKAGGGPLFDIGSHRIDLLNYLFGAPVRATGQASNAVRHFAVDDNATVLIEYRDGVRGMLDVRWHSRITRDEFRIRGTEGEMDLSPLNSPALVYPGGREEIPAPANLHYPCIENFVSAVLEGALLVSSADTAVFTDWVTEQVARAQPGAV